MRLPRTSPATFRHLATAAVVCYALLVVTGGAVRLTGSGLGCLDWPTCSRGHLIATASFHPVIEFSNRMVTIAVSVVSIVAFLGALRRDPVRRDLSFLAGGLVVGLVAQIVLGGLVVLFKLNPYLVALHFVLTFAILAVALVMRHRSDLPSSTRAERVPVVAPEIVWLSRILLGTLSVLVLAGTVVTGSGPHAGASGTKRIDLPFEHAAELHSTIALFLIGMTLATLFALHVSRAPGVVQRRARVLLEILFVQGTLGYTQYFLHDAAWVVELHLAGATAVWSAAVLYALSLHRPAGSPASGSLLSGSPVSRSVDDQAGEQARTRPEASTTGSPVSIEETVAQGVGASRAVPPALGDAAI